MSYTWVQRTGTTHAHIVAPTLPTINLPIVTHCSRKVGVGDHMYNRLGWHKPLHVINRYFHFWLHQLYAPHYTLNSKCGNKLEVAKY